jgi:hypothetical protein
MSLLGESRAKKAKIIRMEELVGPNGSGGSNGPVDLNRRRELEWDCEYIDAEEMAKPPSLSDKVHECVKTIEESIIQGRLRFTSAYHYPSSF